ncbi:hypothetical protein LR003_00605 [candidate division NPL-UPA2 bacterium]|nr:hypothetical protein [candidate division NPL-UPA2 bacterium]
MSKKGKIGAIVFFLFSIGVVIFALKLIGSIEEGRKEAERLTASLEERKVELVSVKEERVALEKELERARGLKEKIERELSQKITELQEEIGREREEKVALKKRLEEPLKVRVKWEERYRELQQTIANLQARLEELPPVVEEQIVEILPVELPFVLVEGEVVSIASPFLNLELNREVAAALKPALSIYRRNRLIRELDTKGIRYVNLVARVAVEKSLQGIRENDQVKLSLSPGVAEMFVAPRIEGEVLDIIRPGFLNINLGRKGLENVEPVLLVYRDGELFRKIELKDMDRLTIMVEAVLEANLRGIRERDTVKLIW